MGVLEIFLIIAAGCFVSVQPAILDHDARLFHGFPGFFETFPPFPFERNFDFTPYDTIFSSWPSGAPDFHMLADFPPILNVPRIEVFCDDTKLSVLVDKSSNGAMLTSEEIQLGDGCFSNGERPNQFVFTYGVEECGTARAIQNGMVMFTNSLHLNLKKPLATWWQTPSTVHISCIPKRSYAKSVVPSQKGMNFNIKAMNPSWTRSAESNVYKRGQVVNLQVSAKTVPNQQLFIQSCFVSASPDPQAKPRHGVIINKGCTAPLGSPHPVVQFVASSRLDMVNFVLNTTYLISELYVHCSVLASGQGVTFGSKSCNYNLIESRWEDLSGDVAVCECCNNKCKSLYGRHFSEDARATVSAGPFVIVDKDLRMSSEPDVSEQHTDSTLSDTDSMMSDAAVTNETISGASLSGDQLSSPPQGVVVVSQDPDSRLTLWLPGKLQDAQRSIGSESKDGSTVQSQASDISNDLPTPLPSSDPHPPPNGAEGQIKNDLKSDASLWELNFLALADGFVIPPQDQASIAEEYGKQKWFEGSGVFDLSVPQVSIPLTVEVIADDLNLAELRQIGDVLAQMQEDAAAVQQAGTNDVEPVIHSKLQFSKDADGTQTLSYEEDVVKRQEGKAGNRRCGRAWMKGKEEPRQKGLRSAFLDFLRKLDKTE